MKNFLEFEKEVKEIELKIEELKNFSVEKNIDLTAEISKLESDSKAKLKSVYAAITPWQKVSVARHIERPYTLDYIKNMCDDFIELHGDRLFRDDPAIVGGTGTIGGKSFIIIGHQKGRDINSNLYRNFGMANPEGYRKALRLMKMAERFNLPILTLVDTAGAYPGLEAEEHGQGEAIARNLMEMAGLKVPVFSVIIGEGGSGGALALAVANRVYMMEYSVYSVISPEGCAAILYKDASKAPEAAEKLKIDAQNLLKMGIVDSIIKEPVGGAHRDHKEAADNIKKVILEELEVLNTLTQEQLIEQRYDKFRKLGQFAE